MFSVPTTSGDRILSTKAQQIIKPLSKAAHAKHTKILGWTMVYDIQ